MVLYRIPEPIASIEGGLAEVFESRGTPYCVGR